MVNDIKVYCIKGSEYLHIVESNFYILRQAYSDNEVFPYYNIFTLEDKYLSYISGNINESDDYDVIYRSHFITLAEYRNKQLNEILNG